MPEAALHVGSGKVRELYALDDDRLLLVASDRISTFDVVLPTEIPDKGRVLTGLSGFWFARTKHIVPNHLLALREELDVSLTALREALKVLSAKGIIDARQKRGTFVRPRSSWNMLDGDVLRRRATVPAGRRLVLTAACLASQRVPVS